MSLYNVRTYREGDEDHWLRLVNESFQTCNGFDAQTSFDFQRLMNPVLPPPFLYFPFDRNGFFLAFSREELVGSILATTISSVPKPRGKLSQLAVTPNHRRTGVGSELLREAVNYLENSGVKSVEARTWSSTPNVEFYKKHGFRPVRRAFKIEWDLAKIPAPETNKAFTLKQASTMDLDSLSRIVSDAYSPYWDWVYEDYGGVEEYRKTIGPVKERIRNRMERGVTYFMAFHEDEPAGLAVARIDHELNLAKSMKLGLLIPGGVCVLEKFRGRGIGSRLLIEALNFLRSRGMEKARVWTFTYLDSYPPAVNMYLQSCGKIVQEDTLLVKE